MMWSITREDSFPVRSFRIMVKRHHGSYGHPLAQCGAAARHDRERAPDLRCLPAFRAAGRRHPLPNPWDGKSFPQWARLGGWLAAGLNWHFALAWPFVITGLVYLGFLASPASGVAAVPPPRHRSRLADAALLSRSSQEHPRAGKTQRAPEAGLHAHRAAGCARCASGFAIYKPVQLAWLTALFGGYELARYWHFCPSGCSSPSLCSTSCWCSVVDPASLRAMITGWYRGRFPSHD